MARLKIRNGNTWEDISAITGPQGIPGEPGADGADGRRGTSILRFHASPSPSSVSDKPAIKYHVDLETLLEDSGFSEVYIGDIVEAAYLVNGVYYTYHYFVLDVNDTYAYLSTGYDLKGAKGDTGDISNEVFFAAPYITTFSEIEEAVSDEKTVILVLDNGSRALLTYFTSTMATFTQLLYTNHMMGAKYTCSSSDQWSTIQGSLAPTASPEFTGTPTAPTAPDGTDTTQVATTEFVQNAVENIPVATASSNGLMSDADKNFLDYIREPWSRTFTYASPTVIPAGSSAVLDYDLGPVTDYEDMTAIIGALPAGNGLRNLYLILSAGWLEPDYSTYTMHYKMVAFNVSNTAIVVDTSDPNKWQLTLTFVPAHLVS